MTEDENEVQILTEEDVEYRSRTADYRNREESFGRYLIFFTLAVPLICLGLCKACDAWDREAEVIDGKYGPQREIIRQIERENGYRKDFEFLQDEQAE